MDCMRFIAWLKLCPFQTDSLLDGADSLSARYRI